MRQQAGLPVVRDYYELNKSKWDFIATE